MKHLGIITKIGPAVGEESPDSKAAIPFRVEVQMDAGPAVLSLSLAAAAELKAELEIYLRARGSR